MRTTLEDLLLEEGLLDAVGLREARRFARHRGIALVAALVDEGLVRDDQLAEAVTRRLHLPRADLRTVDSEAVREVPHDLANARRLIPLSIDRSAGRRVVRVAMADPLDLDAVEEIEHSTGCRVEPLVATSSEVADAVHRHYRGVITKMIPRRADEDEEPDLADEASTGLKLEALVDVLVERGLVDREVWLERVRRRIKDRD